MRYSDETDPDRMRKNLQDHGGEIPEMNLLVKDHKKWSADSGQCVPTRPVVSGRACLNTHLSELLSEILEPVALKMRSTEVSSTEEMLFKITEFNENNTRTVQVQCVVTFVNYMVRNEDPM